MSAIPKISANPLMSCPACGTTQEAACKCGVGYVPAAQIVTEHDAMHPGQSSRMAAKATGLSHETVNQTRKSGVNHLTPLAKTATPLKVVGLDGKLYPSTKAPKAPSQKSKGTCKLISLGEYHVTDRVASIISACKEIDTPAEKSCIWIWIVKNWAQ